MKRYKNNRKNYITKILFIIFLIALLSLIINIYMSIDIKNYSNATEIKVDENINEEEKNNDEKNKIVDNIDIVTRCIVGISKLQSKGITAYLQGGADELELGTGILVSEDGYILTNQHIVGNKYSKCYITLYDGREFKANVLWSDEDIDLAILKIDARGLKCVILGDSNNIRVGENVYAIGNPVGFEFQRTVTSGIISGLNRTVKIDNEKEKTYMEGLIQTDAPINVGNSGGPLINEKGEVIGINSIKIESAEGIGFAIPINMAKTIINTIIQNGEFEQVNLGILAYDKEAILYTDTTLKIDNGLYVVQVIYDSPAEKAGIKEKDIITHIDGNEIKSINDLREYMYTKKPGDIVKLDIIRKNKTENVEIKLEKKS